jgi:hypothetical protein
MAENTSNRNLPAAASPESILVLTAIIIVAKVGRCF